MYHLFLKEKIDKTTKGIMLTVGNKQHRTIDKVDAAYPTAALKPVLLTSKIDADEGVDREILDITNA